MYWTDKKVEELFTLLKEGKQFKEISKYFNKSEGAISSKLYRLGYKASDFKNYYKEIIECKQCNKKFESYKNNNRKFCCKSCAITYNNSKRKLSEQTKQKISKKNIISPKIKHCPQCKTNFKTKRDNTFCSNSCSTKFRWENDEMWSNERIKEIRDRCSTLEERKRLRDIGRFGGFGNRGITKYGIRYESEIEKNCFNLLDEKNIKYEAHKKIPDSSKISDIYLIDHDIWIEIDGIDREKRKKYLGKNYDRWINKLELYNKKDLTCVIVKNKEEMNEFIIAL